jgi:hypothetical protein
MEKIIAQLQMAKRGERKAARRGTRGRKGFI